MTRGHAVIVGAGIGGLAAAIGLRRAGMRVTLLERAPAITEVGAGITLWPNALRALRELGLEERLAPLLRAQGTGRIRASSGRVLGELGGPAAERRYGDPMVGVHRGRLTDLLRDALPADAVRTGAEVTSVTVDGTVTTADGRVERADLVIGADGIDSVIRSRLWAGEPRPVYSGVTAFRAIAAASADADLGTVWGPGSEFGTVPLTDGRLYWFVSLAAPADLAPADRTAFLLHRLRGWPADVVGLIRPTPPEDVLHHDIYAFDAPLTSYLRGRVALLGDSAHAMTPFLGQGGCQALEDAVVLAAAVADASTIDQALARYDAERRPRSQAVRRAALRAGRAGHLLRNPLAVSVRNAVLRAMPQSVLLRGSDFPVDWTPPRIRQPTNPAS